MENGSQGITLLREKLDDPHASEVLARLIDRIDALESATTRMTRVLEEAPAIAAIVTNLADDSVQRAARRGIDVDERLRRSLDLIERITEPEMMATLNRLVDLAENSEGMLATIGDMADEAARRLDLDRRLSSGGALLERATRPEVVDQVGEMFDTLLDAEAGMLSPEAVQMLGIAAEALVAARAQPSRRASVWQAFRAARDPQLQRALGFLLQFGEQFAQRLET